MLEPIAIVGASCRFAGSANSPSKLWDLLCRAPDLSREVPSDRFSAKGFYHKDGEYHGTTDSIKAYWLDEDIKCFDTSLFNITPAEAEAMDPQQRLLLEVVFDAMESAGFPLTQYSGKDVGVYAGCMTQDYETLSARDELTTSKYFATGNSRAIMSNRISYFFNFGGPSMTIDTACSSSLVALNQAILALRAGHCTMACVTGANLMLTPEQFIVESALHMLSPSGKCQMWDVGADGYARGEGFAVLLIKPLSRALDDGDRIEGIIREVGINADGRTNGITMPNSAAQATLIRTTYERAGLDPTSPSDRCQYFEAHGTGTAAGDPREAAAIHSAFFTKAHNGTDVEESSSASDQKLLVGSVKTVIGHTEAAAGLAGVLKVLWGMKHGIVPQNLHFTALNPSVEPYYKHLQIPTVNTPWPEPAIGQPRRASVNSFGFGGANAHAIVESYCPAIHHGEGVALRQQPRLSPSQSITGPSGPATTESGVLAHAQPSPDPDMASPLPSPLPIVISAASIKSLRDVIESYRTYLSKNTALDIRKLSWHQYHSRSGLPYRVVFSAATTAGAIQELDSLLRESAVPNERVIRIKTRKSPRRILGIFTGQGAQWATMSKTLLQQNAVYRNTIDKLDAVLQNCPHPCPWTLREQLMADKESSRMHEAAVSQPLCTAVQIALVDFLRSIGIDFHTVIGHSSGEIAAAYAAGRISAEDAIIISYYRGVVAHLAGGSNGQKGGMMAVGMSESDAQRFCRDPVFDGRICIAASNAPKIVTLSGDLDAIKLANERLEDEHKFSRVLFVDTAYHSQHMARPALSYIEALRKYRVSPSTEGNKTTWISSVKGRPRTGAQDLDCQYWADNMVNQVQFHEAVKYALSQPETDFDCVVEVGPHAALSGPFTQTAKSLDRTFPYSSPLSRPKDSALSVADFVGFIWAHFEIANVDLRRYIEQSQAENVLHVFHSRLDDVPRYPFDHAVRYWRESRISRQYHFKTDAPHELLGIRDRGDNDYEMRWRNILKLDKIPWLEHHSFQGQALLPASAYCVMALDAARMSLAGRPASLVELRDIEILSGIPIDRDSPGVETTFSLNVSPSVKGDTTIDATFALYSCPANGTATPKNHAHGSVHIVLEEPFMGVLPKRNASLSETLPADRKAFYEMMASIGLAYTGPFKALHSIRRRYGYCTATVDRFHADETTVMDISPATLDSCFQCAFLSYASPGDGALWAPFLPTKIGRVQFNLAVMEGENKADSHDKLTVDTHLNQSTPSLETSKPSISVDISIFNEMGETEVQVEDLTVHALASTTPNDDMELYLRTAIDIDPTDEIIICQDEDTEYDHALLAEQFCRVASFYCEESGTAQNTTPNTPSNAWSGETEESVDKIIYESHYADYLKAVMSVGKVDPTRLSNDLPLIIEEARELAKFRNQIGRIMKQITHRYPSMEILCLRTELARPILAAIDWAFQSFTVGQTQAVDSSSAHLDMFSPAEGVEVQNITLDNSLKDQIVSDTLLDLVLVPATLLDEYEATKVLTNISEVMKPGGFLVLVNEFATVVEVEAASIVGPQRPPTHPKPLDIPNMCGFVQMARNSSQCYRTGCILVCQFCPPNPSKVCLTVANRDDARPVLVIRGQRATGGNSIVPDLPDRFPCFGDRTMMYRSLEEVTVEELEASTAVIVIADLDENLMSNMTQKKIDQLQIILRPNMTVLWLTYNAQRGNPDQAASLGFLRTMAAEIPTLRLQVLDLDPSQTEPQVECISRALAGLLSMEKYPNGNSLLTVEPEIFMRKGKRHVPRVIPWRAANDRINAVRRNIWQPINTLQRRVEVTLNATSLDAIRFELEDEAMDMRDPPSGEMVIQVELSSVLPFKFTDVTSGYVCIGRDCATGVRMLALSRTNSSYVCCPSSLVISLLRDTRPSVMILHQLIRCLACLLVISVSSRSSRIVLVEPDVEFAMCLADVLGPGSRRVVVMERVSNRGAEGSRYAMLPKSFTQKAVHPRTSVRGVREMVPTGSYVFNFLPEGEILSQNIATVLSGSCSYRSGFDMFNSHVVMSARDIDLVTPVWKLATDAVLQGKLKCPRVPEPLGVVSLSDLEQQLTHIQHFQILDWKIERTVLKQVKHKVDNKILSRDKTYLMFGMTRDSGHSLCRLLLTLGARNVVLASRNPDKSPNWVNELKATYNADIRILRADVTNLKSLYLLKQCVLQEMPPIGGVINGAMVLEDRVFDQMTEETWKRVLHPKTIGSANLDFVFDEKDLEFFIMTSSFAAIGGHPGQSNYAAANMYMNGLATNRRRRGLAAFALNIGVVYGLGFLQREKEHLYAGLEREGYPPISEHSLHHMFIEAIVGGRPSKSDEANDSIDRCSLTTGLRRFRRNSPEPLHWHLDPRFGHFALSQMHEDGPATEVQKSLQEELAGLEQKGDMAATIAAGLDRRLQTLLQLPEGSIDHKNSMANMGVDSLAAVEVRNWVQRNLGKDVPVMKILDTPSIEQLCMDLTDKVLADRAKGTDEVVPK